MIKLKMLGAKSLILPFLCCLFLSLQTNLLWAKVHHVTGYVLDAQGEPVVGANVMEKGTINGVTTSIDGSFSLDVTKPNAALLVSYIGFSDKTVICGDNMPLRITMKEDSELLDEVVVVGYGSQRKVNLSGAVDQVGAKELEAKPISDISKGLQGMIPNLNIDFASGEPGKAASINLRGFTSLNGGSPLILIDGVAGSAQDLNRIQPEDIESISVLKDAASAAIYGARAAFGVILITTKMGKDENIRVSYNNSFSWKKPSILPKKTSDPYIYLKLKNIAVLNTPWSSSHVSSDERLEWARQRSDNPSLSDAVRLNPKDQTQWEYMGNKDWTAYFLDKYTFSQSHQISISGATAKTKFYVSAGYDGNNGILSDIVNNDYFDRYNMRLKGSFQLTDWFTISNNTSFVATERNKPSYFSSDMSAFYNLAPYEHDVNPNGTWANSNAGRTLAKLNDGGEAIDKYNRFQTTFSGEMVFLDKLFRLNANFSFAKGFEDYMWYQTHYMIGYGPEDTREEGNSKVYKTFAVDDYKVFDLYGTFDWQKSSHHILAVAGFNQEESTYNWTKSEREGLLSPSLPVLALASGEERVGDSFSDWAIRGVFYKLNYTYKDKYILEFNGRYDGSSRFPKDKRFGFFPSVSAAWRIDQEAFFKPITKLVNHFKLRASYGSLGNQQVSPYGYIPTMSSKVGDYLIGGKLTQQVNPAGLVSPNYTWEEVNTKNVGLDINLLNNRISFVGDLYRRDTKGMLTLSKELPAVIGASPPKENAADLKTIGWEVSLGYQEQFELKDSPLNISARFLLSDSRSWITKFDNPNKLLTQYYKGQEIGEIWGLQSDGFFKTKEEVAKLNESELIPWGALDIVPGWPKYKDLDGDGEIHKGTTVDAPKDLSIIGNTSPRMRFGLNLSADWNNFDFSVFVQGIAKRDYYPLSYLYWSFYQQPYSGGQQHMFDFYRPTADSKEEMAKHSKAYINAGLANQNLNSKYPVFQSWLADKNLGTAINTAKGLAIPQTKYLLDGSYLRVKNITLGYSLPKSLTSRMNISRLRLYFSADNIIEWSGVKQFFDPEAITQKSQFGYVYPFNRKFIVGLNLTF